MSFSGLGEAAREAESNRRLEVEARKREIEGAVQVLTDRVRAANPVQRHGLLSERNVLVVEYRVLSGELGHPC